MRPRGRARSAALGAAALAAAVVALPALAQDQPTTEPGPLDVRIKVTPKKAGTPRHPQPIKIKVDASPIPHNPTVEPIVDKGIIRLGKGVLWNGAKHPKCTARILNQRGLGACPKGSIFGRFSNGFVEPARPTPKITLINGGAKLAFAYMQLTSPARVSLALPIHIKRRSGKWAYRLSYDVPPALQVVAGVPISLTPAHGTIGQDDILVTTSCPRDGTWKYDSTITPLGGRSAKHAGTVACRR
ncbi:MAG TPA: hypothetical protein VI111_08355 [Thermoleophilaceae bacterium]